jgi:hypothetical protein
MFIAIGFQVLTAVVMRGSIFWDITLCSLLKVDRRVPLASDGFLLDLLFNHEDGGDMFLRNVGYNNACFVGDRSECFLCSLSRGYISGTVRQLAASGGNIKLQQYRINLCLVNMC